MKFYYALNNNLKKNSFKIQIFSLEKTFLHLLKVRTFCKIIIKSKYAMSLMEKIRSEITNKIYYKQSI